jgi:hypothetical protein
MYDTRFDDSQTSQVFKPAPLKFELAFVCIKAAMQQLQRQRRKEEGPAAAVDRARLLSRAI